MPLPWVVARFLADRIFPPLSPELDDPSPEEQAAELEAQRAINKASGRLPPDPNLQPMPFFSWESAKDIFTMGGRFTLIRHDDEGNPNVGAAFWAMFVAAIGMMTMVLLLARATLNGDFYPFICCRNSLQTTESGSWNPSVDNPYLIECVAKAKSRHGNCSGLAEHREDPNKRGFKGSN